MKGAEHMELTEHCRELAAATADAGQWVTRNAALVRNERETLLRELRRAGRIFRRCARAASRKMCAGVFGPSQAGKSYLISALARDARGNLMARFDGELRDFIREINPEGGKESTGLVTRFTMSRPSGLPQGFPVQLRLLSETDIVKIIANSYFADCEHKEDPESDIDATLRALEGRAGQGDAHIDLDALEDLREYLREFRSKARAAELEHRYWDRAQDLGPRLALEDRIRLYALIWDEVPELTGLLRQLLLALDSLGQAGEAFCPLDALIPRDKSIIDVTTLAGLDTGSGEQLPVVTPEGRRADLPRAVVTALTAELTIVMESSPDDYFEHTDLLDFPGYRSREKYMNLRYELQREGTLRNMFLRGKVAYLFQRYCAERELTSMLLCIGPSNQEVKDLPGVINDWIAGTHGKDPESRRDKEVSLFLVLTKSDMEFEEKAGDGGPGGRWDNRLHASLLDFFGQQYDWPRNWDGRPFNNLFLLRNPNFHFNAVLTYDGDTETGIREDQLPRVALLRSAFLQSELVAGHFRHPQASWDALMSLNDGGIGLIRQSLRPLCDPAIKAAQIRQTLDDTRRPLLDRLRAFYKTDDKEEERQQKKKRLFRLFQILGSSQNRPRLGLLLRSFTVCDRDIRAMHEEAARRFRARMEEQAAPGGDAAAPPAPVDDAALEDWDPFSDGPAPSPAGATAGEAGAEAPENDETAFFAAHIESGWVSRLHGLAEDPAMQACFRLPEQDFSWLVSELATGAARLRLQEKMADAFRQTGRYINTSREGILRQQASMAARIINGYVDWLGLAPGDGPEARTVRDEKGRAFELFVPPPPVGDFPALQEERADYAGVWFSDWLKAFYALGMANVSFDGAQTIDIEENNALGAILRQMEAGPAGSRSGSR